MNANIAFMCELEEDYRRASGLNSRKHYKIFYGQVFLAPILTLGLNPGGDPEGISHDGTRQNDGSPASASASFFEGMENDVLDCEWRENTGLRKLLLPVVGQDRDRFRREIVKTNISFRRSRSIRDINLTKAAQEAAPFLGRVIARVRPQVIILTGSFMENFLRLHALESFRIAVPDRLARAPGFVFSTASARLRADNSETIVVQVGHASRFAWTYDRHRIPDEIARLMRQSVESDQGHIASVGVPNSPPMYPCRTRRTTAMSQTRNPRLAELDQKWCALRIAPHFWRVHHFSDPKFSGKRVTLAAFVGWCEPREILGENTQTLARALDVANRVKGGQPLDAALRDAWTAFPVITR